MSRDLPVVPNLEHLKKQAKEIPISVEAKLVLRSASEESDRLQHGYVGAEHMLLGILRHESSVGASALHEIGIGLEALEMPSGACRRPSRHESRAASSWRYDRRTRSAAKPGRKAAVQERKWTA